MEQIKPSSYATRREYRWAKKAAAKERRAAARPVLMVVMFAAVAVGIITGHVLLLLGLAFVGVVVAGVVAGVKS